VTEDMFFFCTSEHWCWSLSGSLGHTACKSYYCINSQQAQLNLEKIGKISKLKTNLK